MKDFYGISPLAKALVSCRSLCSLSPGQFADRLKKRGETFKETDKGLEVHRAGEGVSKVDLPSPARLQELVEARGMPWDPAYAERAYRWWASDERVDHAGDIIRQQWDMSVFETNSPMPYSHDWDNLPIGRYVGWRTMLRGAEDYEGPALNLLGVVFTRDTFEWADQVNSLMRAGGLPKCSVGLITRDPLVVEDKEERDELGLSDYGVVMQDNLLLENSPCTIPCNPGAGMATLMKRLTGPSDVDMLRELKRIEAIAAEHSADDWLNEDKLLLAAARERWGSRYHYRGSQKMGDSIIDGQEAEDKVRKTTVTVDKSESEEATLSAVLEMGKEQNRLLTEVVGAIQSMAQGLSAVTSDLHDALDKMATWQSKAEDEDEDEDEEDRDQEDEDEDEDEEKEKTLNGLAQLRGQISTAVRNLERVTSR